MNSGIVYVRLEELSTADYKLGDGEMDITGWPLIDESGSPVGRVRDLLFDPTQNAVRYIIVDLDRSINVAEEKAVLLPIGFVNLGDDEKAIILPVMHESQFIALPRYISGEVTMETEMKIRAAIGSPAALRIEEQIEEMDQSELYRHHHFDRGRVNHAGSGSHSGKSTTDFAVKNLDDEADTIHKLINQAPKKKTMDSYIKKNETGNHEKFSINTSKGVYAIAPQENGTYRIFDGENKIGVIYAESTEECVQWHTMDLLEDDFVSMIGQGITAHNN